MKLKYTYSLSFLVVLLSGLGVTAQKQPTPFDYIPDATYGEIADRIACIEGDIPLVFNERVKSFVDYFTVRNRDYSRGVMNRADYYFDLFEPFLEKYDIPKELKYLAIVESGLKPNAISTASAVGLWQFIPSTGKMYGLRYDWYTDDRMDPLLATDAACRHLRDLYNTFDDWELAIAAYNCGPGNVRKAIRRSGYKKRFWDIYSFLPRETRSYLPQFVAIAYTMNYREEHNLYPDESFLIPEYDTIHVKQYMHLETLADQLSICLDDLLLLNPSIKRGAIPEHTLGFDLKVPIEVMQDLVDRREFLYDTASKVGKEHLAMLAKNTPGSTYGRDKIYYRVRSGDVLGTIARDYHVRVSDIKAWNNLNSNMIRVGQRLSVWVLPSYSSSTKDLYASAQTQSRPKPSPNVVLTPAQKLYRVQNGDTLWDISQKSKVSIEMLKSLNNLRGNTIHPGQQLVLGSD